MTFSDRSEVRPASDTRVCHIISSFHPVVGGAEKATERLCRKLVHRGTDAIVLTRRQPGTPSRESIAGVEVFRAGLPLRGKLGSFTFAVAALWLLGTRLRGYHILHVQNIDTPLVLAVAARRLLRRTVVATIHSEVNISEKRDTRAGRVRLDLMVSNVHAFTCINPAIAAELTDSGVDSSRIRAIPNGVDTEAIRPATSSERSDLRESLGLGASGYVVLYVGRLVALKQVDVLMRALAGSAEAGEVELVVVGDGPEAQSLQKLAAALPALNVSWAGMRADVTAYYRSADVFALPSRKEGLSVALMEAMSAGLPCVVTDLPGNRTLIEDGISGLVVPVADEAALRAGLDSLLGSPSSRQSLGTSARREIERLYSLQEVARRHEDLYADLAPKPTVEHQIA